MRCYSRRFFGFIEIAAEAKYRNIFPQMESKGQIMTQGSPSFFFIIPPYRNKTHN